MSISNRVITLSTFYVVLFLLYSTFATSQQFTSHVLRDLNINNFAVGDFNNDNSPDLFGINELSDSLDNIFLCLNPNDSTLNLQRKMIFENFGDINGDIIAGDYDNDGLLDVLTSFGEERKLTIFKNTGNDSFTTTTIDKTNGNIYQFIDIENDGDLDIVSANSDSLNLKILLNEDGTFRKIDSVQFVTDQSEIFQIEIADIDNDGDMDIVYSLYRAGWGSVFIAYNEEGVFSDRVVQVGFTQGFQEFSLSDINNDGIIDVCVTDMDRCAVMLQSEINVFDDLVNVALSNYVFGFNLIGTKDLTNDGIDDIVLSEQDRTLSFLQNLDSQNLMFASPDTLGEFTRLFDIHFADMNLDGNMDIIGGNDRVLFIYENNGIMTHLQEFQALDVSVYPSIVRNNALHINLGTSWSSEFSYYIVNSLGQIVDHNKVISDKIDVATLNSGAYFIRITEEKSKASKTLPFIKN